MMINAVFSLLSFCIFIKLKNLAQTCARLTFLLTSHVIMDPIQQSTRKMIYFMIKYVNKLCHLFSK